MKLNNLLKLKGFSVVILIAIFSIFATSCEKHPHSHEEHFEPVGIVVKDATKGIFMKIFEGKIDTNYNKEVVLNFDELKDSESDEYEIGFLGKDGKEIANPTSSSYKLELVFADKTIAELYQHDGEQWAFHIKALKKGETNFEIKVLHAGHSDFKTPSIKLNIK